MMLREVESQANQPITFGAERKMQFSLITGCKLLRGRKNSVENLFFLP